MTKDMEGGDEYDDDDVIGEGDGCVFLEIMGVISLDHVWFYFAWLHSGGEDMAWMQEQD